MEGKKPAVFKLLIFPAFSLFSFLCYSIIPNNQLGMFYAQKVEIPFKTLINFSFLTFIFIFFFFPMYWYFSFQGFFLVFSAKKGEQLRKDTKLAPDKEIFISLNQSFRIRVDTPSKYLSKLY